MRYHNITKDDMLNGYGIRVVLWVAGCAHHCPGCQNPITHDVNGGILFDDAAKEELYEALAKDYVDGITFSGGDPLHPTNVNEVGELIAEIHAKFPDKTKWLYTGYLYEEISSLPFISMLDVVCDGKFERDKFDPKLHWVGSTNQRVIDVQRTIEEGRIMLYEDGALN